MPTAGPNSPSTVVSDSTLGTIAWTNPGNAAASDNTYAAAGPFVSSASEYLKATAFGFAVPTGATILGITAEVERKANPVSPMDSRAQLVKAGTIQATDYANADVWPTSDAYATYGGPADLWGDTWTPADVNDSGFGFAFRAQGATGTANVDHIRITVTYELPVAAVPHVAVAPPNPGFWTD